MGKKDIIKISITALILGVLISFFYPQGIDLKMPWPIAFNFVLELFYYTLIISLFDNSTGFIEHLFYAGGSFFFRIITSIVFAAAVTTAGSETFPEAIKLGIVNYLPVVYTVMLIAPWVLLSFMKDSYREMVRTIGKHAEHTEGVHREILRHQQAEPVPAVESAPSIAPVKRQLHVDPGIPESISLDGALDYINDYEGVMGCVLASDDGLIIGYRLNSQNHADELSGRLRELLRVDNEIIEKIGGGSLNQIEFTTKQHRIGIYNIEGYILIVISHPRVDNLLGIRLTRSIEMFKKVLRDSYEVQELTVQ
ncbi:MAG: roadblock/LC7 domain-containing protein [candidate division Zixibacteria bacterium]|nr:roadblock/LC7 domain-containing protein [candidate division Zixibacteria bacterium]